MRIKIIISEPTLRERCRKYRRSRSHRQYAPSAATSDVFSRKEEKKKLKENILIHWPFEYSPLSSNRVLWHSVAGGNQSKNYMLSQGLYNFMYTIFKTLSIFRFETIFLFSTIIFPLHFEFVADPWNKKFGNVPLICYRHWTTLLHLFANKLVAVQIHRHISQTYLRESAIPNFLRYLR